MIVKSNVQPERLCAPTRTTQLAAERGHNQQDETSTRTSPYIIGKKRLCACRKYYVENVRTRLSGGEPVNLCERCINNPLAIFTAFCARPVDRCCTGQRPRPPEMYNQIVFLSLCDTFTSARARPVNRALFSFYAHLLRAEGKPLRALNHEDVCQDSSRVGHLHRWPRVW